MRSARRTVTVTFMAFALLATACGSDDDTVSSGSSVGSDAEVPATEAPSTEAPTTEAPMTEAPGTDPGGDGGDGETTLEDVDLLVPSDPAIDDFPRAEVPGDALPAVEVLTSATDDEIAAAVAAAETDGSIVVPATVSICTLVAVWALPQPDQLVVGYEEHPNIDCFQAVGYTAIFVVPTSGDNSAGTWSYDAAPPLDIQPQLG